VLSSIPVVTEQLLRRGIGASQSKNTKPDMGGMFPLIFVLVEMDSRLLPL
jgi:hypothetical protein